MPKQISQFPATAAFLTNDLIPKANASTGPTQYMLGSQLVAGVLALTSQSDQTANIINAAVINGNTSGALATISSGTLTLAGGNNVTLSQAGNAVTISAGTGGGGVDLSLAGNTSGALALISSGTAILAGGNNITLSQNGQSITISAGAGATGGIDLSLSGNTSGVLALISSGTGILAGGNNITLSQNGQNVTISAANQTTQTQNLFDLTLGGNTSGVIALVSSGTLTLAGGNNITLSQAGNAVTVIGAASGTGGGIDISLSGNTSGALALISSGTAILAGGNNITLSQNGQSVTISAANQTTQTQNLFDLTLAGNTSGALALISSGTMTLAGGNNITLSQAGNAVTISAGAGGGGIDVTLAGNTDGTLALVSSGTLTLAGGNNITLSQNGNAVTVVGGAGAGIPTVNFFHNAQNMGTIVSNFVTVGPNYRKLSLCPLVPSYEPFAGNMTINTFLMMFSQSGSTATMSQSFSSQLQIGLYTYNAGTLSLLNSCSTSWGSSAANASLSSQFVGLRHISIHSSQWSIQPTLSQGNYWIAANILSTNVSNQTVGWVMVQGFPSNSPGLFGTIGVSTGAAITTLGFAPFYGSFSAASTDAMPSSFVQTDILPESAAGGRWPFIILNAGLPASF